MPELSMGHGVRRAMNRNVSTRAILSRVVGGRKRRFGLSGVLNVLGTNVILQFLIAINAGIGLATLVSQAFNGIFGYFLYGSFVFQSDSPRGMMTPLRYSVMLALLWACNWAGILVLITTGLSKSLSAIVMIPFLALLSYLMQKTWVFPSVR